MPKGHSVLQAEVVALKLELAKLQLRFDAHVLSSYPMGMGDRVTVLEKQIEAMNNAFRDGNLPRPQYESQFKVWPGSNPATNGS